MRAISVTIYRDKAGDCSNGGISSKFDEVLIIHERGNIVIDENNLPENLCVVVDRPYNTKAVEPARKPDHVGWMFGGTLVYTSDSRFTELSGYGPLKLHDRQETQEEYDSYYD